MQTFKHFYKTAIKTKLKKPSTKKDNKNNIQKLRTQGITYYPKPGGTSDAPSSSTYMVRG